MEYFKNSEYNESAFLFYLGKMRTEDLNNLGKEHYDTRSEYNSLLEECIFIYLAADANNYRNVLKMAQDFYNNNQYVYICKTKGYKKVKNPKNYSQFIKTLQEDKIKSQKELNANRDDMKNRITPYFEMLKE